MTVWQCDHCHQTTGDPLHVLLTSESRGDADGRFWTGREQRLDFCDEHCLASWALLNAPPKPVLC